jgi:hypothetical protein
MELVPELIKTFLNNPNSPFSEDVYRQASMVHYQFVLLKIARKHKDEYFKREIILR